MPIGPSTATGLAEVYDDLVATSQDLASAALSIAPAAAREVLCTIGNFGNMLAGPEILRQGPGGNRLMGDAAGLLQLACEVPPPVPPSLVPLPTGGQCQTSYDIFIEVLGGPNASPPTFQRVMLGPLTYFPSAVDGVTDDLGRTRFGRVICGTLEDGRTYCETLGTPNIEGQPLARDTWQRSDNQPDDCGSLPPPPPAPAPGPITQPPDSPPIPTIDSDGNPAGDVIFQPRVGPINISLDGGLEIPVIVNVGGPNFDVPISIPVNVNLPDFAPSITIGGGGGYTGFGDEAPITPAQPICCDSPPPRIEEGGDEDPEEPPEDPPEDKERITGALITSAVDESTAKASVYFNAKPALHVPRLATLQWEMEFDGRLFIAPEIEIKTLSATVPAPDWGKVTRALTKWETGFSGSIEYLKTAKR